MGMSGQLCASHFKPRESALSHSVPMEREKVWPPELVWTVERSLLLCLGNEPRFLSLPFLSLSPYIDWKYKCTYKMYT